MQRRKTPNMTFITLCLFMRSSIWNTFLFCTLKVLCSCSIKNIKLMAQIRGSQPGCIGTIDSVRSAALNQIY